MLAKSETNVAVFWLGLSISEYRVGIHQLNAIKLRNLKRTWRTHPTLA